MIEISYTKEGLDEALRGLEEFLGRTTQEQIVDFLEGFGDRFLEVAKAYPFPQRDAIRRVDPRPAPYGPQGVPRFREFWKKDVEALDEGGALDLWNDHPRSRIILFPTKGHTIPSGGPDEMLAKGYPLRWYDEGGAQHTRWATPHRGTPGQPVHQTTWEKLETEFDQGLDQLIDQFTATISGGL